MYIITIFYQTGDSFSTSDTSGEISLTWEKLDAAKAALRRIKEHHDWASEEYSTWRHSPHTKKKPEWLKFPKDVEKPEREYYLTLLDDNGKEIRIHAFWRGYFETFYSAEINGDDMRIEA